MTKAAWTPFRQIVADLPDVGVDLNDVGKCTFMEGDISVNDIKINKEKLCSASPVLEAMMSSGFKESSENQIKIDHVNDESLFFFLHYITGCNFCTDVTDLLKLFEIDDLLQSYMIDRNKEEFHKVISESE